MRNATVRITGGDARGRRVSAPDGLEVRPTGAKVRQAFFNILGDRLKGCRFLDLCAGSGLMGLEALSRGAESLTAVEEQRKMVRIIQENLKHLEYQAEVICGDVRKVLPVLESEKFDIIFADPPYKAGVGQTVLELIERHRLLSADGLFVIEHLKNQPLSECGSLTLRNKRDYGQTSLSFFGYLSSEK
jgi:16S rRNA (guanine966-N2)-methyltransferase